MFLAPSAATIVFLSSGACAEVEKKGQEDTGFVRVYSPAANTARQISWGI